MVQVTKHNSLTIAAWNLHVTQSTSSRPISSLEKELRLKIFNRSRGHGTLPTDEGRIILILAFGVLRKLEEPIRLYKKNKRPIHFTKVSSLFYLQNSFLYFILVILNYKLKFLILFNYNLSVESKIEMI
ncbi:LysR family transcriptional regulator [Bacillus rhizoplanae]|uniref:LysR family transcriptional regulator n=1 Tax=Bacillus rhizoplanae TaxID=2880966 RepID=UPI003D227EA3